MHGALRIENLLKQVNVSKGRPISKEEMEALIVKGHKSPKIDNRTMEDRQDLFMEWYSVLDGVALMKYSETIEKVVTSSK